MDTVLDEAPPRGSRAARLASLDPEALRRVGARSGGPRRGVRPRRPLMRETACERAAVEGRPAAGEEIVALWDMGVAEAAALAERYRAVAAQWTPSTTSPPDPGAAQGLGDDATWELEEDARAVAEVRIAAALRLTRFAAGQLLGVARLAVDDLPTSLDRLARGEMPGDWFQRLVRAVRPLTALRRREVDSVIATWDLRITADRFVRELRLLAIWARNAEGPAALPDPGTLRRVETCPCPEEGTASLAVIGPMTEILSLGRRLDQSARAVQVAQRAALRDGGPVPFDDGTVQESARPMTLARLRYEVMTRSVLDTGGHAVPEARFRLNVTVPAMTLLGLTEAPAMIDGVTPLPAPMARELAGGEGTWYRILTDPTTGAFLPLPAQRYTPTRAMLEYLRLRHGTCAVPGCTRSTSWASEADHIDEFDRTGAGRGGATELENLHLLCWKHHQDKTAGLIDPVRLHGARVIMCDRGGIWPSGSLGINDGYCRNGESEHIDATDIAAMTHSSGPPHPSRPPFSSGPPSASSIAADMAGNDAVCDGFGMPEDTAVHERVGAAEGTAASDGLVATDGAIATDGVTTPDGPMVVVEPGQTMWTLGEDLRVTVTDDRDMVTPHVVEAMHDAWRHHQELRSRLQTEREQDAAVRAELRSLYSAPPF